MKYAIILLTIMLSSCGITEGFIEAKRHVPGYEYTMQAGEHEIIIPQDTRYYLTIAKDGKRSVISVDEQEYMFLTIGQYYKGKL
jgi:hypothetical protein